MLDPTSEPQPTPWSTPSELPRGRPLIAWVVIVLFVAGVTSLQFIRARVRDSGTNDRIGVALMTMQGRYMVGAANFPGVSRLDLYKEAVSLNTGPIDRRLRFVTLAGELAGPAEALKQLDRLTEKLQQEQIEPTPKQELLLADLRELYIEYEAKRFEAPALSKEQRHRIQQELGWFGELALAPEGSPDTAARSAVLEPARRTVAAFVATVGGVAVLGFSGLIGLGVLVVLYLLGRLQGGMHVGQPHGGVYAETFALWLVLFTVLGIGAAFVPVGDYDLLVKGAAALLSLGALAWPVLVRGLSWRQVREDIGWTAGRGGALEPFVGIACYAMSFPLVFLAVLVVLGLMALQARFGGGPPADTFTPGNSPAHPIVDDLARGSWRTWLQVLFVASVVAPFVEETMFRGVLYRQLREATGRWGGFLSAVLSATLVSFIFAVIHPQGLIAVPLLMALAFGFTLAREWRGTLVPAIVAHGLNNGLVLLFSITALGG